MRSFFRWATLGALVVCPSMLVAQQTYRPITQTQGRWSQRIANNQGVLPSPTPRIQKVGSGLKDVTAQIEDITPGIDLGRPMTIQPKGAVDLGASTYGTGKTAYEPISLNCCDECGDVSCHGGCGGHGLGGCLQGGWFGGLYYMHLWRDDDNYGRALAFDDTDLTTPVLTTGMGRMQDSSGVGLRLGKMLNSSTAVEFIYWQVFPDDERAAVHSSQTPGNLVSGLSFAGVEYDNLAGGGPQPVDSFFNNAQYLELRRSYDYRNFEVNFLKLPWIYGGGSGTYGAGRTKIALLAGFRYFQATENFGLLADTLNEIPGDDPANELLYDIDVENNMYGFQLGGVLDYCITSRLSAQLGSKFGIYGNNMKKKHSISSLPGGGGGAFINTGPFAGQPYGANGKKNDVAFLGELDLGLAYCINSSWRATGGYRLIAVSGVAQAVDQIPYNFTNLVDAAYVSDQSNLVLHGLYAGVEYAW